MSTRDRGRTRDKPPKPKKKAVERECKTDRGLNGDAESGSLDGAGGVSQREETASLHLQLRYAPRCVAQPRGLSSAMRFR